MHILDIMLKDLTQIVREKMSFVFLILMPIVFTLFMGIAIKGAADSPDPRQPVGWMNEDAGGTVSQVLYQDLSTSDSLRLVGFEPGQRGEINQQISQGQLVAALIIPAGFSQAALAGEKTQIELVVDPGNFTSQTVLQLVRVPVTRLMSSVEIGRLHADGLPVDQAGSSAAVETAFQQAATLWAESTRSGPQIVVENVQGQAGETFDLKGNPYNQTSPGILVQFAIFSLVASATILVQERKSRTLQRMLTTAVGRAEIVAGHLLAIFALVFMQQVILVVFGQFVLQVEYLQQPLGTLLVMIGLSLWVASLGLLIGVVSKGEEQVILFSLICMFLFTSLGGAWFPLETAGQAFAAVGRLTPAAWAMNGFQNILIRGLDATSAFLPLAASLAYAALFFILAVWRLRAAEA
ncbi:MAG: ABC transporter permease [Anaerolineales bacterium]|nr:ABC transporter permease [Anaerolineales bacterium]